MLIEIDEKTGKSYVQLNNGESTQIKSIDLLQKISDVLQSTGVQKHELVRLGMLCSNVISLSYFKNSESNYRLMIELPKKSRQLKLQEFQNEELIVNVGCPRTIVTASVIGNKLEDICCAVIKESVEKITEDTPIYHFPFGNVYSDHRVCTGQVSLNVSGKKFESIPSILESIIFDSAFNGDLNKAALPLIRQLQGKKFDDDALLLIEKGTINKIQ